MDAAQKALASLKGDPVPHDQPLVQAIVIINDVLALKGLGRISTDRVAKNINMKNFAEAYREVDALFKKSDLDHLQHRVMLMLSIELLADNLRKMGVPLSATLVARHFHTLPAVLDLHFPGYAANGMLQLIVKSKENRDVRKKRSDVSVQEGRRFSSR